MLITIPGATYIEGLRSPTRVSLPEMTPIVALDVYRNVAASMDPLFVDTPFRMTAILDLRQEPMSIRYNTRNLMTVLFNLHPRSKVFIIGAAISHSMTAESVAVWDSFVREVREEGTFVINVGGNDPDRATGQIYLLKKDSCVMNPHLRETGRPISCRS